MTIPVEHEDIDELKKWGIGLSNVMEDCVFCRIPTRYWNKKSNNPCCQSCAKTHKVSDFKGARQ